MSLSPAKLDSVVGASSPILPLENPKHARLLAGPSRTFLGSLFFWSACSSAQTKTSLPTSLSACVG